MDLDFLVNCDISEIFDLADDRYSVMVVKNEKKFEWASLMLFNCAKCKVLTPEYVSEAQGLHTISWVPEIEIGELPLEYYHLVGYCDPSPDAKMIHYTQGMPCHPITEDSEHRDVWVEQHKKMNSTMDWESLMGNSVHAAVLDGKRVPKYKVKGMKAVESS